MADATTDGVDAGHAASVGRRYLIQFEEDTLRQRPLWIRLIIEFLGTFILVTVAAGSGVINHYAGGGPISGSAPQQDPLVGPIDPVDGPLRDVIAAPGPGSGSADQARTDQR